MNENRRISPDAGLVARFAKNSREDVPVRLTEYNGHKLVDIRAWCEDADGAMKPTKGLTLRRECLPDLLDAVKAAVAAAAQEPGL